MFTTAPDITVDTTIGQVVVTSPAPTPTLSPAGPPMVPPYYPVASTPVPLEYYPTEPLLKHFVGKPLSIYGYGPIDSKVSLKGFGVSEITTADNSGLFRFSAIYSFSYTYPELCIQAVDEENRVTQPTCIPPLPNTEKFHYNSIIPLEVGPILLSPTLSLTDNEIVEGGESYLSGKTTPDTDVFIYLARNKNNDILSFVPTANAYSLPVINTTSNEVGEFDINMPTSGIADYKVFASTKFGGNLSAKSNTLQFAVVSSTKSFLEWLVNFFLQNKLMIFIIAEVVIFVMLFILALKSTTKRHKRHNEKDYLEYLKLN